MVTGTACRFTSAGYASWSGCVRAAPVGGGMRLPYSQPGSAPASSTARENASPAGTRTSPGSVRNHVACRFAYRLVEQPVRQHRIDARADPPFQLTGIDLEIQLAKRNPARAKILAVTRARIMPICARSVAAAAPARTRTCVRTSVCIRVRVRSRTHACVRSRTRARVRSRTRAHGILVAHDRALGERNLQRARDAIRIVR